MLSEIEEGSFLAYDNLTQITDFQTTLVNAEQPWGVYTISGDDVDYTAVLAAASEYSAIQVLNSSAAGTAKQVPVTANNYRAPEQFVLHTAIEYGSVDGRSFAQAVVRTLKSFQDKTSFTVTLPTGRIVVVKFMSVSEIYPFQDGVVNILIQAEEYNPFPIFSELKDVNRQFNSFFGNQGRIASAPTSTTVTPTVSDEVAP